jgi:hypothetical protein
VDPTFLKDILISLLSDLLALKFKQSCADSRPQNGQIEVLDSQTPDSEILDLESPDFQNSSSRIHRSYESKRPQDNIDLRFQYMDGLLYYQGLLYIPNSPCQLQVLQSHHDFPTVGYFGFNKTMELISRDFWWLQMWKSVKDYITTYGICFCSKIPRHHLYGLLRPLQIPKKP